MTGLKNYEQFVKNNRLKAKSNKRRRYSYDLQVFEDDNRFTLGIPPTGELIEDNFVDLSKREALYKSLEGGEIYNWLCEVRESIQDDFLLKTFRKTKYKKY